MGLSLKLSRLMPQLSVSVMIGGELAIGRIFAPQTSHGGRSPRPRRATTRHLVTSLVLGPIRSSFLCFH